MRPDQPFNKLADFPLSNYSLKSLVDSFIQSYCELLLHNFISTTNTRIIYDLLIKLKKDIATEIEAIAFNASTLSRAGTGQITLAGDFALQVIGVDRKKLPGETPNDIISAKLL
jgi:hypothetical protein